MTALTNHKVEHARINKHGYYSQWDKIKRDFGEEIRRSSVEAIAVLVSANKHLVIYGTLQTIKNSTNDKLCRNAISYGVYIY